MVRAISFNAGLRSDAETGRADAEINDLRELHQVLEDWR